MNKQFTTFADALRSGMEKSLAEPEVKPSQHDLYLFLINGQATGVDDERFATLMTFVREILSQDERSLLLMLAQVAKTKARARSESKPENVSMN